MKHLKRYIVFYGIVAGVLLVGGSVDYISQDYIDALSEENPMKAILKTVKGAMQPGIDKAKQLVKDYANVAIGALTTSGLKINNPGNLRPLATGKWHGQVGVYTSPFSGNFVIFDTPANGLRALTITALNYQRLHGINNLRDFGNRWAPANDNMGFSNYGYHLAQRIFGDGRLQDEYFDIAGNLTALVKAIILNENGTNPYNTLLTDKGIYLAASSLGVAYV